MISLTTQVEWWIILAIAFLVGLLTAFFTGLSDAAKPRYEMKSVLDADGNPEKTLLGKPKEEYLLDEKGNKTVKEKAGVITKEELLECGDMSWKGALYAVTITGILMVLHVSGVPYLSMVFGNPMSVQFLMVASILMAICICLGLATKAWAQGGFMLVATTAIKDKIINIGGKIDETAAGITKKALEKGGNMVDDVVTGITNDLKESLDVAVKTTEKKLDEIAEAAETQVAGSTPPPEPTPEPEPKTEEVIEEMPRNNPPPTDDDRITCPKCGVKNPPTYTACKSCGANFVVAAPPPPATPEVAELEVSSEEVKEIPREEPIVEEPVVEAPPAPAPEPAVEVVEEPIPMVKSEPITSGEDLNVSKIESDPSSEEVKEEILPDKPI